MTPLRRPRRSPPAVRAVAPVPGILLLGSLFLAPALAAQNPVPPGPPRPDLSGVGQGGELTLRILPEDRTLIPGDSLRLQGVLVDAEGNQVPGVELRFQPAGGFYEGVVREDGTVVAGATGVIPVAVVAVRSDAPPVVEVAQVRVVPGPAARVAVSEAPPRLVPGQSLRLSAEVFSALEDRRADPVRWESSDPAVLSVSGLGVVRAQAPGRARITALAGDAGREVSTTREFEVISTAVDRVEIMPSEVRARQGDVIDFQVRVLDPEGREIEGLEPTWTLAPGQGLLSPTGRFVGYDAGDYTVLASFGSRSASAAITLEHRDVRRPVEVVGRLPRTLFHTEEVWLHPGGEYAYLGTGGGGDRFYAIDIRDPANPVVTDSVVANTRRVNDLMTTPDGRYMVFTREGAADRRNGLVVAQLYDPAHPVPIAEFTEGVTAGVHSSFVYHQEPWGTHVYLTNNGTGALHIVDLNDPYNPREVAQWRTPRPDAARTLHDVDVQDGLAYASYWNDGLVILDVGNGGWGGSPDNPQLVSWVKYDLNEEYRDVEARHGPGFIRGTHTAWRHGKYVFVGDEVFPVSDVEGAKDASASRAFGNLHVFDVTDLENPVRVAWWRPDYGGVHNLWAAGDTLYMGAYNAGFRTFDISGELLGDLGAQAREMVHVHTGDLDGFVPNDPMTWGVVVRDGLAYVNDLNNGLWIIRMKPREEPILF
jgi:hypothetical protein